MESSFHEISRTKYVAQIQADNDIVSVIVPQNATADVAGNKNLASNVLQVRHCKDLGSLLSSTEFCVFYEVKFLFSPDIFLMICWSILLNAYSDCIPTISSVISAFATAIFLATSFAAGLLTVSTASLQSVGALSSSSSLLASDPTRNLFVWNLTHKNSLIK